MAFRGFYLAVLLATLAYVNSQLNVDFCRGNCNLAICMQLTGTSSLISIYGDVMLSLVRSVHRDQTCSGNVGVAWYSAGGVLPQRCNVYPPTILGVDLQCAEGTKTAAMLAGPTPNNNLQDCLNLVNSDPNWWQTDHSTECRYTLVIVSDRTLANPTQVQALATTLHDKGVRIHCYLIGPVSIPLDPVFNSMCDAQRAPNDIQTLWDNVEGLYGAYDCCGAPTPTVPAITTTTTRMTQRPVGPCDGCKIINGVGYNPDSTNCNCFQRCDFKRDGSIMNITQCCACGMFWDHDILQCMVAGDTFCSQDPCAASNVAAYPYVGNCRSYWTCSGGRTLASQCCAPGEEFDPASAQCVNDANGDCQASCKCDEATTATYNCLYQANALDPHTYYVIANDGTQLTLMPCAPGTNFNQTTCHCSSVVAVPREECPIDFDMQCSEIPALDHANRAYIHNFGVAISATDGECNHEGTSRFLVPRYANMDWRYRVAAHVRFDPADNPNDNAPLISNTDCDEPSSIEIRLMRGAQPGNNPILEGYLVTTDGTFTVSVPYRPNQMQDAYLSLRRETLKLSVRYSDGTTATDSTDATGRILRCKCAVQIGYGYPTRYFNGKIDEVQMYLCEPSNFHAA